MKGISYTYFTTDNAKSARELVTILREAKAVVPPQLEEMSMYGGGGGGRGMIFHFAIIELVQPLKFQAAFLLVVAAAGAEAVIGEVAAVDTEVEVAGKLVMNSCILYYPTGFSMTAVVILPFVFYY
jgi:hypothetical protein